MQFYIDYILENDQIILNKLFETSLFKLTKAVSFLGNFNHQPSQFIFSHMIGKNMGNMKSLPKIHFFGSLSRDRI